MELTVHDSTSEDVDLGADARLVRVAKALKARLLTNDYALSQVARLQRVAVLNLSDLTRALRPTVVAGDEIDLHLVKEGRESHQAVGYLPDGTMIVVNHARAHVGKTRTIVVASALQTTAGRLIFAELKTAPRKRRFRTNRFEALSQVHFALRHCAKQTLSKTKFLLVELNFMPQYDGGSWFGDVREILTRDFGFFLANTSLPGAEWPRLDVRRPLC